MLVLGLLFCYDVHMSHKQLRKISPDLFSPMIDDPSHVNTRRWEAGDERFVFHYHSLEQGGTLIRDLHGDLRPQTEVCRIEDYLLKNAPYRATISNSHKTSVNVYLATVVFIDQLIWMVSPAIETPAMTQYLLSQMPWKDILTMHVL